MKKRRYIFLTVFFHLTLVACSEQTQETLGLKEEKAEQFTSKEQREWSYDEFTGPAYWGKLDARNAACVQGSEQSPINIKFSQVKVDKKLKGHQIDYEPTTFTLLNNGHTIQANATTESNSMVVEGNMYKLSQFHFHTPSEHQFNGQNYVMELHLVHHDENGKHAVLGVMIQEGRENEILAPIWRVLPRGETETVTFENYLIDLQALLPSNQMSFHYDGSLTTPPCTEEVKWIVLEESIEMSKKQLQVFQQIFSDNHRPVQPLNEREIIKK